MNVRMTVLLVALLAGCGGGGSSSTGSEGSTSSGSGGEVSGENEGFDNEGFESGEPSVDHGSGSARELLGVHPPPRPFDDLSHEEQEMWMVSNVLPIAAEDFRAYDANRYAQVDCATCHGDNAEANHYEMPTNAIPPLPTPGSDAWNRMSQGRAFQFMAETVVPTMATLLGEQPFNPETHQGFGCFDCHTQLH